MIELTYYPPTGVTEGQSMSISRCLTIAQIRCGTNFKIVVSEEAGNLMGILIANNELLKEDLK